MRPGYLYVCDIWIVYKILQYIELEQGPVKLFHHRRHVFRRECTRFYILGNKDVLKDAHEAVLACLALHDVYIAEFLGTVCLAHYVPEDFVEPFVSA